MMLSTVDPKITFGIVISATLCVLLIVSITRHIVNEKYGPIVQDTSPRLHGINVLYPKYNIYVSERERHYYATVNSKAAFDRFNFDLYLQSMIKLHYHEMTDAVLGVRSNIQNMKNIKKDYNCLPELVKRNDKVIKHHSYFCYHLIEKKLVSEAELSLKNIPLSISFICVVEYTSPKGRNHYSNRKVYSEAEMLNHLRILKDRETRQTSASVERSKMSSSLRYDVMKRDNFKCVICGRSQKVDGVKLEVDHIIPVSRGGKSTMDNLQTLCFECNRGKANK